MRTMYPHDPNQVPGTYPQAPGSHLPPPPSPYPGYPDGFIQPPANLNPGPNATATLSPIWQERFAFFQRYGSPGSASKETRQALRAMGLWRNIRVSMNFLEYLFGPICFAVKGMWRQALTFLAVAFGTAVVLVLLGASDRVVSVVGSAFPFMYMFAANYAYFRHVNGERSWNPFAGLWSKKR